MWLHQWLLTAGWNPQVKLADNLSEIFNFPESFWFSILKNQNDGGQLQAKKVLAKFTVCQQEESEIDKKPPGKQLQRQQILFWENPNGFFLEMLSFLTFALIQDEHFFKNMNFFMGRYFHFLASSIPSVRKVFRFQPLKPWGGLCWDCLEKTPMVVMALVRLTLFHKELEWDDHLFIPPDSLPQ